MNHTEALKAAAAPHLGLIDMYEAEQVVRAYLTARADNKPANINPDAITVWRKGTQITVAQLLADFGENA